jgi:hypothetical protein
MRGLWAWAAGLLVLSLIAVGAFGYLLAARYSRLLDIETREKDLLLTHKDALSDQLGELEEELGTMQDQYQSMEEELGALSETADSLQDSASDARNTISQLRRSLEEYESALQANESLLSCGFDDLRFDYSDDQSVSTGLRAWVADIMGPVHQVEWYNLWNGASTTMHMYRSGENATYFIVFFDDSPEESLQGIFWIAGGCWLDRPFDTLAPSPDGNV